MTEENAAELAKSILNSKTGTLTKTVIQGKIMPEGKAKLMNTEPSDVSKLVSYGYNLLRGCPEGDFVVGGTDPGIMTSKQIFKFTFDQGKTDHNSLPQPDQVDFEPSSDISLTSTSNVYGGGKSYRDAITTAVSAAGMNIWSHGPYSCMNTPGSSYMQNGSLRNGPALYLWPLFTIQVLTKPSSSVLVT